MTVGSLCRYLPVALITALAACTYPAAAPADGGTREGALSEGRYRHHDLGWTFMVPPGWKLMSAEEIAHHTGRGARMLEKTVGAPIEQQQIDLLYLKHGRTSMFTSVHQRISDEDGPYDQQQEALFEVIAQAYRDAKIPIRTERGSETIGGTIFQLLHVRMLTKDLKSVAVHQYMYSGQIGQDDLVVSVTAPDGDDLETGLSAWRASTFDPISAVPAAVGTTVH